MSVLKDPEDVLAVDRYPDRSVRKVVCKLCGQVLYDHAAGEPANPDFIYTSVGAHLEFSHAIAVEIRYCQDPACWAHYGHDSP